jgi:hypothetical protein
MLANEVLHLIGKEIRLELKQKYVQSNSMKRDEYPLEFGIYFYIC